MQEDAVLGKLRIRLSTLQPWTEVEARLPMLADRDKGGSKVAYAHLTLKVRQVPQSGTQRAFKLLSPVLCRGFAAMPQLSCMQGCCCTCSAVVDGVV